MAFRRRLCIASHVGIEKKTLFPEPEPRARPHFSIKLSVTPLTSLSSLFFLLLLLLWIFYTLSIVLCGKFENGFMLCSPSSVDNVLSFRRFLFFPSFLGRLRPRKSRMSSRLIAHCDAIRRNEVIHLHLQHRYCVPRELSAPDADFLGIEKC